MSNIKINNNIINLLSNRSHGIRIYTDINDKNYKYQLKDIEISNNIV